jgi:hypothetical protein
LSQHSKAQAREDIKPLALEPKSGKLLKATGWQISEKTGKWVSHPNYIGDVNDVASKSNHFFWLQTARFSYAGKNYFILYKKYLGSASQFHYISGGEHYEFNEFSYTVLDLLEYSKLIKSLDRSPSTTILDVFWNDMGTANATEADMITEINSTLKRDPNEFAPLREATDNGMIIKYVDVNGQKVVRFNFGTNCKKDTNEYFETDPTSFKALFLPLTPVETAYADSVLNARSPAGIAAKAEAAAKAKSEAKAAELAKEKAATDAKRADSLAQLNAKLAIFSTWKTIDTLRLGSCKWLTADKSTPTNQEFEWVSVSSFVYKNQKLYVLSYKSAKGLFEGKYVMYIFDEKHYAEIKDALNAKAGSDIWIETQNSLDTKVGKNVHEYQVEFVEMLEKTSYDACLGLYVKKGKVKFVLPGIGCSRIFGVGTSYNWQSYECELSEFSKLF